MSRALVPTSRHLPESADPLAMFAEFLRLDVADGAPSDNTVKSYYGSVKQYAHWCQEQGIAPAQATEDDLKAYRRVLQDRYERGTVATKLAALRRFYAMAAARGLRPDNPAEGLRAPKDRTRQSERIKFLPFNQYRQVLASPDTDTLKGKRDAAMLALMGLCGLRVSEVVGITLDALDLGNEPAQLTVTGKGQKRRGIYLTANVARALRLWLDARPDSDSDRLFLALDPRTYGGPLSARSARRVVDAALREQGAKRERVSAHSLRHSCGTWAAAAGAPVAAIQALFGHASIATTGIYVEVADRIKHNPTAYLEGLLASA